MALEIAANPQSSSGLPVQANQPTCACAAHQLTITLAIGKAIAAKRAALSSVQNLDALIAELRQLQKAAQV